MREKTDKYHCIPFAGPASIKSLIYLSLQTPDLSAVPVQ